MNKILSVIGIGLLVVGISAVGRAGLVFLDRIEQVLSGEPPSVHIASFTSGSVAQ